MNKAGNWQILAAFMYPHEAHMARNYLFSEGIDSELRDEFTVQVDNFYSNAIGGVKLLVKTEDFSRGMEVLKKGGYISEPGTKEKEVNTVVAENESHKNVCPFCSSENISVKKVPSIWAVIILFIVHAAFPILRKSYICYDCGREWKFQRRKV